MGTSSTISGSTNGGKGGGVRRPASKGKDQGNASPFAYSSPLPSSTPWWRAYLLRQRDRQTQHILKIQSYRTPLLDKYFSLSSLLGEELFYILFLPTSSWLLESHLAIHFTMLLAMSVGLGNILKNFFLIPRPPHPPVWVHANHEKDHGLPSTHTMTAITIPWYLLIYYGYLEPAAPISVLAIALVFLWTTSVAASRLYNGHHTPMDVAAGAVLGIVILQVWTSELRPYMDSFIATHSIAGVLTIFGIGISMLAIHPIPPVPTPAYAETGLVTGTAAGAFLGLWLRAIYSTKSVYEAYHGVLGMDATYPPVTLAVLKEQFYLTCFLRFVVGVVLVMAARLIVKTLGTQLVVRVACFLNKDSKYASKAAFKHSDGDAIVKFLTYTAVGFTASFICHIVFIFLGLHLPLDDRSLSKGVLVN